MTLNGTCVALSHSD